MEKILGKLWSLRIYSVLHIMLYTFFIKLEKKYIIDNIFINKYCIFTNIYFDKSETALQRYSYYTIMYLYVRTVTEAITLREKYNYFHLNVILY